MQAVVPYVAAKDSHILTACAKCVHAYCV